MDNNPQVEPQAEEGPTAKSWGRRRNALGILNWELALIIAVSLVAGVVATIGSSLLGVR